MKKPRPTTGGTFERNPKTGKLTPISEPRQPVPAENPAPDLTPEPAEAAAPAEAPKKGR